MESLCTEPELLKAPPRKNLCHLLQGLQTIFGDSESDMV